MVAWDEAKSSVLLQRLDRELTLRGRNNNQNSQGIPDLVVVLFDPVKAEGGSFSFAV